MNDRAMQPDPTPNLGPHLAAVERRLAQRIAADPPAALLSRVLMAVDDAVSPPRPSPRRDDDDVWIPAWEWAVAAALGLALTVPVVASVDAVYRAPRPTIVARLRAAGVADESLLAAVAGPERRNAVAAPVRTQHDIPPRRPVSHVQETQRLLKEML